MAKLCKECGYELKLKWNSTLYHPCPRCKVIKKLIKPTKAHKSTKKFNLYKTTAWEWLRKYVLLYYADSDLIVKCSTSPHLEYKIPNKNIHVGHWIKCNDANSTNNSVALNFYNLAPQSARDNTRRNGCPEIMEQFLIDTHGIEKIEELKNLKKQPLKLDLVYLQQVADEYKYKFKELLKERNIQDPWK